MGNPRDAMQISVPYSIFRQMEDDLEAARKELAAGRRTPAPTISENDARAALEAAIPIVQFAAGSLNPESHRGWPHDCLHKLGELLEHTAGDDANRRQLGHEFQRLAKDAERVDDFRASRSIAATAVVQAGGDEIVDEKVDEVDGDGRWEGPLTATEPHNCLQCGLTIDTHDRWWARVPANPVGSVCDACKRAAQQEDPHATD